MRSDESKPLSLMTLRAQDDEKAARTRKIATSKNSVLSLVLDGEEELLSLKCSFPFFYQNVFFSDSILSWGKFRYKKTNGDVWASIDKCEVFL